MQGKIYWDNIPAIVTRVVQKDNDIFILFEGEINGYGRVQSGRVVLKRTIEFQTLQGVVEYIDVTGKFILDYTLEGSFEDESYEIFSGIWKEEGGIYQFEISLEPEVHELEISKKDEQIIELANKIENSMINNEQLDFSAQLSRFFSDWMEINPQKKEVLQQQLTFEQKLDLFFKEFRDLPSTEEVPEQPLFVDSMALESFFQNLDLAVEPIRAAKKQGFALNVWKAAGLKNDEVRHSKVLKWFLDCRGDHGQGNAILLQLLRGLPLLEKYQPERYFTTEECCPLGNQESRVDIEIDADEFLLFIEIKINATEGEDQLKRYIDIAQAKAKKRDWLVVYLTKNGKLPEKYEFYKEQKRLIGLSWKKLAEIFYEYVNENVNSRSVWLVKQFADHIKNFN